MPTVLRIKGYRFFFYSNEGTEPRHVHVEKDEGLAKYWLDEVELVESYDFSSKELKEIQGIIEENQELLKLKWDEYFN